MKKFVSLMLALVMLFSMVPAQATSTDTVTCQVRISTMDMDLCPKTIVEVSPVASETVFGEPTDGVTDPTAIDLLVEAVYLSLFDADMDPTTLTEEDIALLKDTLGGVTSSDATFIDGMYGLSADSDNSWLFSEGKATPMTTANEYVITNDADVWFYYTDWLYGYRGYLTATDNGDSTTIHCTAIPICNEMFGTVTEEDIPATITIDGTTEVTADESGSVTVYLPAGTHTMTAAWEDDEVGYILVQPYTEFNVADDQVDPATIPPSEEPVPSDPSTEPSEDPSDPVDNPGEGSNHEIDQDPAPDDSTPSITVAEALEKVTPRFSGIIEDTATDDVSKFWNLLAQYSILGESKATIAAQASDSINAQKVAKVIIAKAMLNQPTTAEVSLLNSWLQEDGTYNNTKLVNKKGEPKPVYATEQVWCLLALAMTNNEVPDTAYTALEQMQNPDGGWGYSTWSDVGTTCWVLSLQSLLGKTLNEGAKSYVQDSWPTLVSSHDSNSMAAWVSTGLANEDQVKDLLSTFNEDYFYWGSDVEYNAMATANGAQALGDLANGSVYARIKENYEPVTGTPDDTKPDDTKPSVTPTRPTPTESKLSYTLALDLGDNHLTTSGKVSEGTTVYDVVTDYCNSKGYEYKVPSEGYIESITVNGTKWGYGLAGNGLDGLLYEVNGTQPEKSMAHYKVSDKDSIRVFYTENYKQDSYPGHDKPIVSTASSRPSTTVSSKTKTETVAKAETKKFLDTKGHWAEKDIEYAATEGLLNGYPDGNYNPDLKCTRAMVVQTLYNGMGRPKVKDNTFDDVPKDMWCYDAISWAQEENVVTGTGTGFNPNGLITREEMATIVGRFLNIKSSKKASYKDESDISSWALPYVRSMKVLEIMVGYNGYFNPKAEMTRAELATILTRMVKLK